MVQMEFCRHLFFSNRSKIFLNSRYCSDDLSFETLVEIVRHVTSRQRGKLRSSEWFAQSERASEKCWFVAFRFKNCLNFAFSAKLCYHGTTLLGNIMTEINWRIVQNFYHIFPVRRFNLRLNEIYIIIFKKRGKKPPYFSRSFEHLYPP